MNIDKITKSLYDFKIKEGHFKEYVDKHIGGKYKIEVFKYNIYDNSVVYYADTLYGAKKLLLEIVDRIDLKYNDIELYKNYALSNNTGECVISDISMKRNGGAKLANLYT